MGVPGSEVHARRPKTPDEKPSLAREGVDEVDGWDESCFPALSIQVENEDKGNHAAGHQLSKLGELSRSD